MDDDFAVDVTDLRSGRTSRHVIEHSPWPDAEDDDLQPDADETDDGFERTSLDGWPGRSRTHISLPPRYRRQIGTLVAGCAVVLALIVAFASTPNSTRAVAALLSISTPVPAATLPPGSDQIALVDGVPWGTLAIDGKPNSMAALALQQLTTFTLSPGRHTVRYLASPFPAVRCTVSVPARRGDTCPVLPVDYVGSGLAPTVRVVDLGDVPEHLSAGQLAAIEAAIAPVIERPSSPLDIEPGDHYHDANGTVRVATRRMLAQQVLTLSANGLSQYGPRLSQSCHTLCPYIGLTGSRWLVEGLVTLGWRYSTPDGQILEVLARTPRMTPSAFRPAIPIAVSWDTPTWHASDASTPQPGMPAFSTNVSCMVISYALPQAIQSYSDFYQMHPPDVTSGCAERVELANQGSDSFSAATPTTSAPTFLFRLGVLMAVNDQAARAAPNIPHASSHEAALVAQWDPHVSLAGSPVGTPSIGSAAGGAPAR